MFLIHKHFVFCFLLTCKYLHEHMAKNHAPIVNWVIAIDLFVDVLSWSWLRMDTGSVLLLFGGWVLVQVACVESQ